MNDEEFLEAVRDEQQTELSRLGSSKSLYADTGGAMDAEPVERAVASIFFHAQETFEAWADDEDGPAGDLFAEAAEAAGDHYGAVAGDLDDAAPGDAPAIYDALGDLETTVERVAGYVGWALVTENKVSQAVGFFVGQAAPGTANTFRDIGGDLETAIEDGAAALTEVCVEDSDWDLARATAVGTVQAAYDEYVDELEAQGVNPKPVC